MRQLALDLPVERVDDKVRYFGPKQCQRPLESLRSNPKLFSAMLDGGESVNIPWRKGSTLRIQPTEIFLFDAVPGPGSEWMTLGLARYADEIEFEYDPMEDDRFMKTIKDDGMVREQFDGRRWERWLAKNGQPWQHPRHFLGKRKIKVRLPGWRFRHVLQNTIRKRAGLRRHTELCPLSPLRHSPVGSNRQVAHGQSGLQRRRQVWAFLLH